MEEVKCLCFIHVTSEVDQSSPPPPHTLSEDTATRLIPLICAFPKLRDVCALSEGGYTYGPDDCTGPDNHREIFESLINHILGACKAGAMPKSLDWLCGIIDHMTCPNHDGSEIQGLPCRKCRDICKYFPMEHLLNAEPSTGVLCLSELEVYRLLAERQHPKKLFEKNSPIFCQVLWKWRSIFCASAKIDGPIKEKPLSRNC